jgi:hypothetical protein
MTTPRPVPRLVGLADGRLGIVDEAGKPVADATPLTMTAGDLRQALLLQLQVGHQLGTRTTAQVGARVAQAAAAARQGVTAAFKNSTSVRRVVRDEHGNVAYTVEERIPITTKETSA